MTTYFIKHPVTAIILNIMIILVGVLCLYSLPIREYPSVYSSILSVSSFYPNASAELVESSITNILEGSLAGIENVDKITSWSHEENSYIELNFCPGTDINQSLTTVRDAVNSVKYKLPKEAREPAISRTMISNKNNAFIIISLESLSMDNSALTHYANLNLINALRSLKGVGSVRIIGSQPYTCTITLDPKKMYNFGINADEIYDIIKKNDLSLPVGNFQGQTPATLKTQLNSIEDYKNLIIKKINFNKDNNFNKNNNLSKNKSYQFIPLQLVADVKLKPDDKRLIIKIDGNPALALSINKTTDSNPIEVSNLVHKQVRKLQQSSPPDLKINVVMDESKFIRSSIKNIRSSILETIIFVLAVVFIFLRNIRATIIPFITIPISLIGSLLFLKIFGFSINIMTLLAMVLAIGIVVDDAIIILENITRHIEHGLSPLDAAIKGSHEIGFAIIAMTLTLASVYAPIAFIQGPIGKLFIEFAVTLAGSVIISGVVALTLSPLMCTKILKNKPKHYWPQIDYLLAKLTEQYSKSLEYFLKYRKTALCILISSFSLMLIFFKILPGEIAPREDHGLVYIEIPILSEKKDIDSLKAFENKVLEVENALKSIPETLRVITRIAHWGGNIALLLKPLPKRKYSNREIVKIVESITSSFPLDIFIYTPNYGIPGIDNSSKDCSNLEMVVSTVEDYQHLFNQIKKLQEIIKESQLFKSVRDNIDLSSLNYIIDFDNNVLSKFNFTQQQIAKTIEIFFSGDQSLTFQKDGIPYDIILKGATNPWTLNELYLTNVKGKPISLGTFTKITPKITPPALYHYNKMRSATLFVELYEGDTIESSLQKLSDIINKNLPNTYKQNWSGLAKDYNNYSTTITTLFLLSIIFIYAILSIQFEDFIDSLIVLLTIPLACSGALFTLWICGQSLNIYTQVGLITLIGLITKHGILIVEFSNQLRQEGLSILSSVHQAAILRLRPILMTTGAMVFGAIPLILSHDYGAKSRHAIGYVLIGGLSFGTFFTLFIIPTLYYTIKSLSNFNKVKQN